MTNRQTKHNTEEQPRYMHRSSEYVSRTSGRSSATAKRVSRVVTPPDSPYASEISVLEAARIARERLPSAAPSAKHKTLAPKQFDDTDEGLITDKVRLLRSANP